MRCTGALPNSSSSEPAIRGPREAHEERWHHIYRALHHRRRQQESLAKHSSTSTSSSTAREGVIESAGMRSKQRCAARTRAPTPWQSRPPSQLLSTSACMSMACSRVADEILRRVADGWRLRADGSTPISIADCARLQRCCNHMERLTRLKVAGMSL